MNSVTVLLTGVDSLQNMTAIGVDSRMHGRTAPELVVDSQRQRARSNGNHDDPPPGGPHSGGMPESAHLVSSSGGSFSPGVNARAFLSSRFLGRPEIGGLSTRTRVRPLSQQTLLRAVSLVVGCTPFLMFCADPKMSEVTSA
jgi:hypothetical protein